MREAEFFWCKQCKTPVNSVVERDICPKCNSSLVKGKITKDTRREVFFAAGLSLLLQYPLILINQVPAIIGPMIYGILTIVQLVLSTLLFVVGVIIVGAVRLSKAYPYSIDTEEPIDLQVGFRDQILMGEVCCYALPFIGVIYVTVSLLALYIGQTLLTT